MAFPSIRVGSKAPQFSLPDVEGALHSLKRLSGQWVVVYFYPRDNTPGCTIEAREFSAGLEALGEIGAVVFGISPDDLESHRRFIAKYELTVTLLSDPDRKAIDRYGAWGEVDMHGRTIEGVIRSTVIVDPEGNIAWHWPRVEAEGHAQEVADKLCELQLARGER